MITSTHQLSKATLSALQPLLDACHIADKAVIPIYPHILESYRPGPPSLFYQRQEKIVGFLAFFHFYPAAAEIALCVHPDYRRQGIAKVLWQEMCQKAHTALPSIKHLIVSSPHDKHATWLKQHAFEFEQTEYDMSCDVYLPELQHDSTCTVREANHEDIELLHIIDHACFNPNRPEPILRIRKLLETSNIKIFLMFHQTHLVGQVHLVFEPNQVRLTDLAVLPDMQRQGFGQALIEYSLKYAYQKQQKKITLTVAAKNNMALRLYQNVGFQIYNAVDYYKRGFLLDRF